MPYTDYVSDNDGSTYRAELDLSAISDETMTDSGLLVGELEPIRDASLSPGDGSPVGRTPDGDLAYPIFKDRGSLDLSRAELLLLAHLRFVHAGLKVLPTYPLSTPVEIAVMAVVNEAVPQQLFNMQSNHGQTAYLACLKAVVEGDIKEALTHFEV